MCGIFGIAMRPGGLVERSTLERMAASLDHRGPDDRGMWTDGTVGLGATRLAIIDVEGGRQPVFNEDGSVVAVQNGELYNYRDLRRTLLDDGHRLEAQSDTEVLPHLYEDDGPDFPSRLRGMFAVAVWDAPRARLVLARDRLGIKPLFYANTADGLVFASEIKALLAAGIAKRLDVQALHDYLALDFVPGPRTMFDGIRRLPPGHRLIWSAGAPLSHATTVQRWWSLPPQQASDGRAALAGLPRNVDALTHHVGDKLAEAVAASMVSDVPVGAFLSGGLDSSLVVALMRRATDGPLSTFTIGFQEASYDERSWARQVAAHVGADHHERVVAPEAGDLLERLVDTFDEPFADSSAIAAMAVSALAAEHVKVVLSGDGGDEVFGGYVIYQADRLNALVPKAAAPAAAAAMRLLARSVPASDAKMGLDLKLGRLARGIAADPLAAHHSWRQIFTSAERLALYAQDGPVDPSSLRPTVELARAAYDAYPQADRLNRLMAVDQAISLPDDMLTKVDRTSMAHGLEVRVPLLDHELVEMLAAVPSAMKVRPIHRGLALKWLLRRIATQHLPAQIVNRPKAGFHVPVPAWLKGELRPVVEHRLGRDAIARQGIFDADAIAAVVEQHMSGRANRSRELWGLLVFSTWWERHLV